MAAEELAPQVGVAPACRRWVCRGPPSTAVRGHFPATNGPLRHPPGH